MRSTCYKRHMTTAKFIRSEAIAAMCRHVLIHGLQTASLRPLAAAAGTSDRMLIYHFISKDALLAEIMRNIAADMAMGLTEALASNDPMPSAVLLRRVWALCQTAAQRPVLRIWLELAAVASREGGAKQQIANAIAEGFLQWTRTHLATPEDAELVLTVFEGMLVLQEAGQAQAVQRALDRICDLFDRAALSRI